MKSTLFEIYCASNVLNAIGNMPCEGRVSLKAYKTSKSLLADVNFYEEKKNEIINKYAFLGEDGRPLVSKEGLIRADEAKYGSKPAEEIEALGAIETEVDSYLGTMDEFVACYHEISRNQIIILEKFFSDYKPPEEKNGIAKERK
jgi:hypothetical protein